MEKVAFVALAKNPTLESFKTRLFNDTKSIPIVARTYELLLQITNETLSEIQKHNSIVHSYWAMNCEAAQMPDYLSQEIGLIKQGLGTLGDRLHNVYSTLKASHRSVIIVGSDLPFLNYKIISETLLQLSSSDVVIGPSDDGGFYLFAARIPLADPFWTEIEYSRSTTLDQMTRTLRAAGISISFLKSMTDIDDLKSFSEAISELKQLDNRSYLQDKLVHYFINDVLTNQKTLELDPTDQSFQHKVP